MVSLKSFVDEFNGRFEALNYLRQPDTERIDLDFFASVSDHERDRAAMILSGLIAYRFEPSSYWYDDENNDLLLEFREQDFVVVINLINEARSEEL